MKEDDLVKCILAVRSHDNLLLFTNKGRVFRLKAYEIPEASRTAKGTALVNLLELKADEKVQTILSSNWDTDRNKFITLVTKQGLVKKTAVDQFENIRSSGIIAIVLGENDQLVWGAITSGQDEILLVTHGGTSIRFKEAQVKATSRDTRGVKGITLHHDYVADVEVIDPQQTEGRFLLTITEHGMGKMTDIAQYPIQSRSGMGLKVALINDKTGSIAKAFLIDDISQDLIITTKNGQTIKIDLQTIPHSARVTQGVILIRLDSGDQVATATLTGKKES